MTPQQCFGIIIRTFGLILSLLSFYYFFTAAYLRMSSYQRPHAPPSTYAVYGVMSLLVSLYFLKGASGLIRFCYPPE